MVSYCFIHWFRGRKLLISMLYLSIFVCIYGLSKHVGGGGVEKLYSFSAKSSNFFSIKGLFLWNFFQSSDSSDSITYFWICLLSSLHVLCSECPYFVIKSVWMSCLPTDFPLQKPMNQILPFSPLFQIHSTPARILESLSKSLFSHFNKIFQERDTLTGVQSISL